MTVAEPVAAAVTPDVPVVMAMIPAETYAADMTHGLSGGVTACGSIGGCVGVLTGGGHGSPGDAGDGEYAKAKRKDFGFHGETKCVVV